MHNAASSRDIGAHDFKLSNWPVESCARGASEAPASSFVARVRSLGSLRSRPRPYFDLPPTAPASPTTVQQYGRSSSPTPPRSSTAQCRALRRGARVRAARRRRARRGQVHLARAGGRGSPPNAHHEGGRQPLARAAGGGADHDERRPPQRGAAALPLHPPAETLPRERAVSGRGSALARGGALRCVLVPGRVRGAAVDPPGAGGGQLPALDTRHRPPRSVARERAAESRRSVQDHGLRPVDERPHHVRSWSMKGFATVKRYGAGAVIKVWGHGHRISKNTISLLDKMLQIDPRQRISLGQVLSHPMFDRRNGADTPSSLQRATTGNTAESVWSGETSATCLAPASW
ncbi:hypothetical protein ON010_g10818 [Phytophthora cinnamomi]|nr:hypothetical protein ON010_g10818 [Phytophthora cinnamomi]